MMLFALVLSVLLQAEAPSVTCQVSADPRGRVYVLDRPTNAAWRLSFKDRESGQQWIRLSLPGAEPVFDSGGVRLSFRNGNGGRQVTLEVTPKSARLDVFVDYGLDVNIEPDLDPEVDRMTTGGPVTALSCRVTPPPAP